MILSKKKINKVLLIFPPVVFSRESPKQIMPPLGISYLAAVLKPHFQVQLLDAAIEGYNFEQRIDKEFLVYGLPILKIKEKIAEFSPDVIGISCLYSSQFLQVAKICDAAKELSEEIITVIGGSHPTFLAKECLAVKSIDFIVLGEGEQKFLQLLNSLNNNFSLSEPGGVAYRENGAIRVNTSWHLIDDLDSLPFPERQMLPLEKYFKVNLPMGLVNKRTPAVNMITSRGCVFGCSFCSSCNFWGKRYRVRSADNVLEEMSFLKQTWGIRELKFFDDNLTLDGERAKRIFQGMVNKKLDFTWNTPNGIDVGTLDEEMLKLMKKSGCYELTLAIESGDAQVQEKIINKPCDLDKALRMARCIKKLGIDTYGFFIIGFPGETKTQIRNTLNFINKIRLDRISLFIANPLPGTKIYELCKQKGYLNFNPVNTALDYFYSRFETENFDSRFLKRVRRNWYWTYNLKLILRNPFKFFKKYSIFLFKRPLFLSRLLFAKFILPTFKSNYVQAK